ELKMEKIGHFQGAPVGAGGPIDIVDYYSNTLFVANGTNTKTQKPSLDIVKIDALKNKQKIFELSKRIDIQKFIKTGEEVSDLTCIKVSPNGKFLALSVALNPTTEKGYIVITNLDGEYISHYKVGALPDNLAITPDSLKVIIANEGEPGKGLKVDPEGSISILDLSNGLDKGIVTDVKIDSALIKGELKANLNEYILAAPHKPTYAQALEPEYVSIDKDGKFAYVTFQEDSAIGKLDISNKKFISIESMGTKDHSKIENSFAIGKNSPNLVTANVFGMYQPDGIKVINQGGETYLITANEGDARDYGKNIFVEDSHTIGKLLDEGKKINVSVTEDMKNLKISKFRGLNEKGEYEKLYSFGARSFSIFKVKENGIELVFDSGNKLEEITQKYLPKYFNVSNTNLKTYSRNNSKGPEPEDVEIGIIDGKTYVFVGLERIGGVVSFDISNINQPEFAGFFSGRDYSEDIKGDVGIEGLKFVAAEKSPIGKPLLISSNEISNSIAIYEIKTK
ncbi:choice-of-anchor I family protein, partial [Cetobacterium sp.]|uniref:choice-of-anchor I family protein n=1 Tax=Cetobacterium sp. TaxID=2071632 RepID=UPI003F2E4A41